MDSVWPGRSTDRDCTDYLPVAIKKDRRQLFKEIFLGDSVRSHYYRGNYPAYHRYCKGVADVDIDFPFLRP